MAGPNSLWHIDGHRSLVTLWTSVIHEGIDGFPRFKIVLFSMLYY